MLLLRVWYNPVLQRTETHRVAEFSFLSLQTSRNFTLQRGEDLLLSTVPKISVGDSKSPGFMLFTSHDDCRFELRLTTAFEDPVPVLDLR